MIKRIPGLLLAFFSSLIILSANAAELRGQLSYSSTLVDPRVSVTCNGKSKGSATIDSKGSYAVRGLQSGQDCSFQVSAGASVSRKIPFSTARSVTIYSGKLKLRKGKILVLKQ